MSTHHHSVTTRSEQPTTSFTRSLPDLRFDSFTQTILIEDICAVNTHVHTFNNLVWTWMGDIKLPNKWWSVFCRSSIIVIRAYLALSNFKTTVKQFTVARCIVCYLVLLGSLSSLHSPENGEWCGEERWHSGGHSPGARALGTQLSLRARPVHWGSRKFCISFARRMYSSVWSGRIPWSPVWLHDHHKIRH